jgi:hypothetical protein
LNALSVLRRSESRLTIASRKTTETVTCAWRAFHHQVIYAQSWRLTEKDVMLKNKKASQVIDLQG